MLSLFVGEQVCGELMNRWKRKGDSKVLVSRAPSANPPENHGPPSSSGLPGFGLTGEVSWISVWGRLVLLGKCWLLD